MKPTEKPIEKPTRTAKPTEKPDDDHDGWDDDNGDDDHNGWDDDNGDGNALSGTVWYDLNADGSRTSGEPGIPGISVRLIGKRTMADAAVTGSDGSYRFPAIPAGGYTGVEFLLPDGYACTLPGRGNDARPVTADTAFAEAPGDRQVLDAGLVGNYRAATPATAYGWVLGTVWSDDDQNGVRDETYGMTGVEVRLLDAGDGVAASARTGYHDRYTSLYLFGPLMPGEYSLAFSPPDGYTFTTVGGDSHADPLTGITPLFAVGGGETVVRDAGLLPAPARVSPAGGTGSPGNMTATVTSDPENGTAGDDGRAPPAEDPPSPGGVNRTIPGFRSAD
ncbi:SdrD B-like domain-containing protein [Methanoculleus sp. 10]|uniref:SdrD B-like domain-containing protein n=1 Tax=Methanoculleus sp. 10 TaxID=430615 RepID=UPI0025E6C6D5|nr:SdrD B-like domain-containing protein [Methanoculleus sp. 10]